MFSHSDSGWNIKITVQIQTVVSLYLQWSFSSRLYPLRSLLISLKCCRNWPPLQRKGQTGEDFKEQQQKLQQERNCRKQEHRKGPSMFLNLGADGDQTRSFKSRAWNKTKESESRGKKDLNKQKSPKTQKSQRCEFPLRKLNYQKCWKVQHTVPQALFLHSEFLLS